MKRRALIVDDEDDAREFLRGLLAAHPEIEIVAEAANVTEAIAQFKAHQPDLIFLDVQMPKRDGFSLLPELRPVPNIVFITAYDVFAVKAFEVNAADFLLKPIQPERLALALNRLAKRASRKAKPFAHDDRIFLYSDLELRVVLAIDITHIEADQNYSHVHIAGQPPMLIRRTMAAWNRLLPSDSFFRVYRSAILNLHAIKQVLPLPHHRVKISFIGSTASLELGRLSSRRLRKKLLSLADSGSSELVDN